jgi:general secretion pathway protein H
MRKRVHLRRRPGFTLIELSVVLVLVGVVFLVTFPNLAGLFSGRRLMGFSREMAGALDYARARAVIEGRPQTFRIDRQQGKYSLRRKKEAAGDYRRSEEEEIVKSWKIPEEIKVSRVELDTRVTEGFEPVIRFYPRGNSNGAVISLETARGDRTRIRVKPYTGRSEIMVN